MTMYIQIILLYVLQSTVFSSCQYKELVNHHYNNKHLKFVAPRKYVGKDENVADDSHLSDYTGNYIPRKFDTNGDAKTYIFRNVQTDLVMESVKVDTIIKVSHYCGRKSQLWTTKHAGNGKFLFKNKQTGGVLDVSMTKKDKHMLITHSKHGESNQLWFVEYDGIIVSDFKRNNETLALTVTNGNKVYARPINCDKNQQFVIQSV